MHCEQQLEQWGWILDPWGQGTGAVLLERWGRGLQWWKLDRGPMRVGSGERGMCTGAIRVVSRAMGTDG